MATPADPILASTIWTAHTATYGATTTDSSRWPTKLTTGLRSLNEALNGGLDYGSISCISAEADSGVGELALALLVSHLLGSEDASATVIDTTLSFDLRKLHARLVHALQTHGQDAGLAMGVLGRLKIMKVFDFVGLTESMAEVADSLEGRASATAGGAEAETHLAAPRGTVGDSEDEEDEMLDEPTPPEQANVPCIATEPPAGGGDSTPTGLLLIDSISHVAAPLLKNNHAQAQALLTSFMRSLGYLTRAHDLCTILINGTVTYANSKEESPSIFISSTPRPALGKTFNYLLDLHLLVHQVPKTAVDAKAIYGGQRSNRDPEMGSVVEVLQDRSGGRIGRWAAFCGEEDGRLKVIH